MKVLLAVFAFSFLGWAQGPVKVTRLIQPEKALLFEATVPASLDEVWEAFTTSKGLSTWLTPGAVVDLREGGEWTAHFPNGATGGGAIVSYVPKTRIVMSATAPPMFPHVSADRTTATWEFQATDSHSTRVTLKQTGWKEGAEWDKAYDYLADGNKQLLETLQQRFTTGPIDWTK